MDWNDKELVLSAVQRNGGALEFASEALRADKEVVLAAVQNHGYALQFASDALRNDKEVVLAAVQQYGRALECASKALQNDQNMLSWAELSRAESLWRKYRERYLTERILQYWGQQTMKAGFDADGKAIMQGRGAKRAREEYQRNMGQSIV